MAPWSDHEDDSGHRDGVADTDGDPRHGVGDVAAVLRSAGLRVTAPRRAVLTALAERPHSTADAVTTVVRGELGSVSTQAVYDVLAACVEAGLVRRIEPAGSAACYETRTGDNPHHPVRRRRLRDRRGRDRVLGALPRMSVRPERVTQPIHRSA